MDETGTIETVRAESGVNSTITLFLGLYLLVLAFFIVLVSISSFEHVRSKAVMDSLTSTFAAIMPPITELTAFNALEGDVLAGQRFQEQVTRLFSSAIEVIEIEVVQPGRAMRVRLAADALFQPGIEKVRPELLTLLDRIVAALSGAPAGLRYDMELVLGSDTIEHGVLPIGLTMPMQRIGTFAREMVGRGAPPGTIAVGLKPGKPHEAVLWFYVRAADEGGLWVGESRR